MNKLNKQCRLQLWMFFLSILMLVTGVISLITVFTTIKINGALIKSATYVEYASMIAYFVIWILAIVNSVNINTHIYQSTALIVFSVIPIYFVGLIITINVRKKYKNNGPQTTEKIEYP